MKAKEARLLTQHTRNMEIDKVLDRIKSQAAAGYDYTQLGPLWPQTITELQNLGYTVTGTGSNIKVEW